ncbi:MAG: nickel pincer cofactor biosynthesis protein LarB [Desulfobacterales bacterium]|nr:nickel pincer cofactor biosynthesis protein LarB [Desulfobacterales bacterium]MDD4071231.1 nickel pincer cofactor biosynthesis protein LarB [Desulfobacterales bacterium]MDD4393963.1 nickel pincer cofactor biosynthesis protein LarB [Desulfobacterales bacterium]
MTPENLKQLLEGVKNGNLTIDKALEELKHLPYRNLGFARIDNHRCIRTGVAEMIYCEGKSLEQIRGIVTHLPENHKNILGTRAGQEAFDAIKEVLDDCIYHKEARMVVIRPEAVKQSGAVAVVCAGTSDIPVAEEAALTAEILGSRVERFYDVGVAGIHRLLDIHQQLQASRAIVAVAGMEGALASVVAGLVDCPVIGVPTSIGYGASFGGIAALLSMLNSCAPGVSVVNIDNGFGAGCQAHLINCQSQKNALRAD